MKCELLSAVLPVLLFLSGCGQSPTSTSSVAAEVRGEPIAPRPAGAAVGDRATAKGEAAKSEPAQKIAEMPYPLVGFDKLSGYAIEITDELLGPVTNDVALITAKTEALIPETVKAFNNKPVSLRGFMLPLKVEGGLVSELLIMKDQSMCCYGTTPKIHEWVSVKMTGKGVKPVMDQPVTLQGTLHVGEMRENGYLTGIYQLTGERMGPLE